MIDPYSDEHFMRQAIQEAKKSLQKDEVPIGAVVVAKNNIIARGHNLTEQLNDVTAHAEMQAITAAAENLGGKYLKNCTLYVTMEPCVMCAGALNWSQITKVVFGAHDERRGACRYDGIFHPKTEVVGGLLEDECGRLVKDFFKKKR
ncbi:MAG: tRNA-specific adenosine deaminase [Fluviicola sp.]|nr:MAG: tRNA-specific adenosine deaminase [Fluviicola sp.]